ncbi:hypothetical protein BH10ACT3_BH10ACT3_04990 [soil metagenome]
MGMSHRPHAAGFGFPKAVSSANVGPVIGVDEVAELRSLLRRRDIAARQLALGILATWSGEHLDQVGGRAVLEAASGRYPSVARDTSHPAETLARMLWAQPRLVPVGDVLRVFIISGERSRRAFLHLLALRGDDDGLRGLEFLLGPDGPSDLIPVPTTPLLDPILDHPDVTRLVPMFVALGHRPGWTWHVAGLLHELQIHGRLNGDERAEVVQGLGTLVSHSVDACDRMVVEDRRDHVDTLDGSRTDRERVSSLAKLLVSMPGDASLAPLFRMLSSADPRVSAVGAVALVERRQPVGSDRFEMLARDPAALSTLYRGLAALDATCLIPERYLEPELLAQADLVRWLSNITELGRAPDEIEPIASRQVRIDGADDGLGGRTGVYDAEVHLFRFRMRAPHWSHARGWMIGTAGEWTYSCYAAEDAQSLDDHIESVRMAASRWPDPPAPDEG